MDELLPKSLPVPGAAERLAYDAEDEYRPEPETPAGPPAWQDGSIRIGIHTSIAGDIAQSLDTAHGLGANALQIFSASPRMWQAGNPAVGSTAGPGREKFSAVAMARFRARREELGLGPLVVHANYLINLAATNPQFHANSLRALAEELTRADQLELPFLVLHPGAHLGAGEEAGLEKIAASIDAVFASIPKVKTRLALETTAGQGS